MIVLYNNICYVTTHVNVSRLVCIHVILKLTFSPSCRTQSELKLHVNYHLIIWINVSSVYCFNPVEGWGIKILELVPNPKLQRCNKICSNQTFCPSCGTQSEVDISQWPTGRRLQWFPPCDLIWILLTHFLCPLYRLQWAED